YGVKSISMDDIASQLGISKKTIYQYYSNKAELVNAVSESFFKADKEKSREIIRRSENAVHELVLFLKQAQVSLQSISNNAILEIRKYYPNAWTCFEDYTKGFVIDCVRDNLQRGVKEGYYRPNLQIEIVTRLRVAQFETALRQDIFPIPEFDPLQVQTEIMDLYFHGITTPKGKALLDEYLQQEPGIKNLAPK
ncbi:MAG: TetR/AcrR family transcriptional regulator, partial [Bacteroidota bacterium]